MNRVRCLFATCQTFTWSGKGKQLTTATPFALDFVLDDTDSHVGQTHISTDDDEDDNATNCDSHSSTTEDYAALLASDNEGDMQDTQGMPDALDNEPQFRPKRQAATYRRRESIYDYE
jgi:hypothetical protein